MLFSNKDATAEFVSMKPCRVVMQRLPLDYVNKMPRCLESSMAQSKRDVSNEQAESDSDSGNSLFITQKPVPEAVRSGRRRNYDLLSNLTSPEDVVEREGGSCSSNEEPRTVKKDGRKKCEPPKYTFPFLAKGRRRPRGKLLPIWNKTLNNFVMGGFFKCVRELLEGYQREGDVDSALPTEDMEGDYISPLSEAEEMSDDEDVRVVEKKCFVKPSKRISRQTWCTHATQQRRRKVGNAGQETSPGAQTKLSNEIPAEELCEPGEAHRSPRQYTQKNKEATTEPQNDVLHTDDLSQTGLMEDEPERQSILHSLPDLFGNSNDSECSKTINTRKKKKKDRDPECGEPDGLHVAKSVNVKVQETPSLSEGSRAELSAMQTRYEQEINERSAVKNLSRDATVMRQEKGDIPDSKQKKKKRKKSASEHFRQEVDGNLESGERMEDSMISVSCNLGNIGKKREKKRKRRDEDDDESQSSAAVECLNDDAEIRMNKKKRKKEETVIVEEDCNEKEASNKTSVFPPMSTEQFQESSAGLKNSAPFEETLESSYVEIKQHNKKLQSSSLDVSQDGEEGVGVNFSNDAGTLRESTGTPLKKKKRRKRHDEDVDPLQSSTTTDPLNDGAEIQTKKKRRKKEEAIPFGEECEEKEASNRTSDLSLMSKNQFEQSGNGLGNSAESETLEQSHIKRKKHKKKQQSSSMDVSQDGEEGVGVNFSNDAGTLKEGTGTPLKKKKKKIRSDGDVDPLQSSTATDPLNDGAEIQTKKKKRKKEEAIPFGEECEEKEASNRTSDLLPMSKGQFEESGIGLGNSTESETLEQSHIKRKKQKKKKQSTSNDTQNGEEGVDKSFCEDIVTSEESTGVSLKKKKKKKTLFSSEGYLLDFLEKC